MQAHIFDNLEALNDFIANRKMADTNIIYKSWVVNQSITPDSKKTFEIVERWCVFTK